MRPEGNLIWIFLAASSLCAGCGQDEVPQPSPVQSKPVQSKPVEQAGDHSGWWCVEHGIPEEECSMCSAKVAADFQKKGDWCKEHDRARSQCFLCDPKAKERYAAVYRTKYGEEPPPTELDEASDAAE